MKRNGKTSNYSMKFCRGQGVKFPSLHIRWR